MGQNQHRLGMLVGRVLRFAVQQDGGVKITGERIMRVYKRVSVDQDAATKQFRVLLDGRGVVTPLKNKMIVPTRELAQGIAMEWDLQADEIKPQSMHLTTLAATAIDDVSVDAPKYIRELLKYSETDATCIRDSYPKNLVQSQCEAWDPLVAIIKRTYGIAPVVTSELVRFNQDQALLDKLQDELTEMSPFELIAVHALTSASKSLFTSLAVAHGDVTARDAAKIALVEESHQIKVNGLVQGYHDLFLAKTNSRIGAATLFLRLLGCGVKRS
eukprot:c26946_g1_i1.p1 GENE.c26946_g1_i1~~c26946_g1_i1.p1  ORF type:complete len:272 (-),score=67.18 c26946_g1_i1:58-873(-)